MFDNFIVRQRSTGRLWNVVGFEESRLVAHEVIGELFVLTLSPVRGKPRTEKILVTVHDIGGRFVIWREETPYALVKFWGVEAQDIAALGVTTRRRADDNYRLESVK